MARRYPDRARLVQGYYGRLATERTEPRSGHGSGFPGYDRQSSPLPPREPPRRAVRSPDPRLKPFAAVVCSERHGHVNGWNSKKETFIVPQLWFFVSIAFSFIAWGIVTGRYIWPELRLRQRAEALRPLLILHSFRFIGLAFLVPGVVSPDLPPAFAHSAAYGDIIAAMLALLSLLFLPSAAGVAAAWIFSLWGSADILNAFYQANHAGLLAGQLGAAFFLPTLIVPLLLITHGLAFRILLQHRPERAMQESRHLP